MKDPRLTVNVLCRTLLFHAGTVLVTTVLGIISVLVFSWLPYRIRAPYLLLWNRFSLWWGRIACGMEYQVFGMEHIPSKPVVVLSKHESQWETIYLQLALHPIATILKKELFLVPGFGWGLRMMQPIAIDRGSPRDALKKIMSEGKQRLAGGLSVLVFPEGTRTAPGVVMSYARGGASLAVKTGVQVLPVTHNAGSLSPKGSLVRYPGTITVIFGEPIDTTGRTAAEVTALVETWTRRETARLK